MMEFFKEREVDLKTIQCRWNSVPLGVPWVYKESTFWTKTSVKMVLPWVALSLSFFKALSPVSYPSNQKQSPFSRVEEVVPFAWIASQVSSPQPLLEGEEMGSSPGGWFLSNDIYKQAPCQYSTLF